MVSYKKVIVLCIQGMSLTPCIMRDDCDLRFATLELVFQSGEHSAVGCLDNMR